MVPDLATDGRLAAYFHAAPDAIVIVDGDGEIVRANERVEDVFGYDRRELEGEPVERLMPAEFRSRHAEARRAYFENPERRAMGAGLTLRGRRRDGSTFPVDISLSPMTDGGEMRVMAVIRDITERTRLQRKYRTLLEAAPDAAFVVDADTDEITEVNQQATALVDAPEEKLIGQDRLALFPEAHRDQCAELFDREFESGDAVFSRLPDGSPLRIETTEGDRVPVEISARTADLDDRRVVIAMVRDISKRRASERDLKRQLERFKKISEILSHDLRNPLNVAEGHVEFACEHEDVSYLEAVSDAHERMERLIDDTLSIIREGYGAESIESIELASVATECWEHVATADATLRIESDRSIRADPRRISHVFENLFRNAVEHGGSEVSIRVGALADGFYVEDDGPGVPPEERDDVFDPGFTTTDDGTGLGLDIVAEIADAHGWAIDVVDGRDGGARFEITGVE
ncbi:PAS domain S-box protein [Halorussus marinus]|uniref:PAS domain S-box protein n=1 Tax=Halorussus marinus TaxID=2505976 RepID=UPI0010919F64|nr:PAS domain S-box protein [Halorussus marinus]